MVVRRSRLWALTSGPEKGGREGKGKKTHCHCNKFMSRRKKVMEGGVWSSITFYPNALYVGPPVFTSCSSHEVCFDIPRPKYVLEPPATDLRDHTL